MPRHSNGSKFVKVVYTQTQANGGRRVQAQSMATNIFERMASKWYLVHHHGSPIMR